FFVCGIVVECARFILLYVLIDRDPHDDVLVPAVAAADPDAITLAEHAMRLWLLAVDIRPSPLARALGLRSRLEQTRDVEPDIQTNRLAHVRSEFRSCPWF